MRNKIVSLILANLFIIFFGCESSEVDCWPPQVPFFSQVDPAWSGNSMGYCTIGGSGCTMTSVTMALNYYGWHVTPAEFNDWMNGHSGYNGCDFVWEKISEYTGGNVWAQEISSSDLAWHIDQGYPVVARTSNGGQHWVLVVGRSGDNYFVHDPLGYEGGEGKLLSDFSPNGRYMAIKGHDASNSIYDQAVSRNGGSSKVGSIQHTGTFGWHGVHWYHGEWRSDGEDVYVQNREGGEYNQPSGMIYDALGGARRAYYNRTEFWRIWTDLGGPHSWLGPPITDEYWNGDGQARQDFKKGYLYWSSNGGTTTNYYPIATPGWYDSGWNNSKSYAFAEAYERCNARNTVGEAMNRVHGWGSVEVQNFNWGSYGDCGIVYCPFYHAAFLIRTGFWEFYTQTGGPNSYGYPCGEEYGRGGEAVQEFEKAIFYWNGSASVEMKSGNDYGCSTSNGSNGLSDMINDVPDMGGPQFGGPDDYDPFADGDHDGYSGDYDCNDNDASINPGADENCNDGVDNDCDWLVDSDDSDCPEEEHEDPDYGDDDDAANDDDDDDTSDPAADADNDGYSAGEDCNDSDPDVHPDAISSAYPEGFWQQGNSGELCWNSWDGNNWGCIPAGYHNRGNMNWYLPYEGQQALDCACDGNLDGSYGCWAETASSLAYTNCWSGNGIYITYDPAYLPAC